MAAATVAAACSDSVTGVADDAGLLHSLVLSEGVAAPLPGAPLTPRLSEMAGTASVGGSVTSPVVLTSSSCSASASQTVTVTYSITGNQTQAASFKVNTVWTYSGGTWSGSAPTTVSVPARASGDVPTVRTVNLTVTNASTTSTGATTITIVPFDVVTTGTGKLSVTGANVAVHTSLTACPIANTPPPNTAPVLVVPTATVKVEATSSAGASVNPAAGVTATDAEDGSLTSAVVCTPAAGTFAIGEHTINCSVTDAGGLVASGSYKIEVEDTTPAAFTNIPSTTVTKIAQNASGWSFAQGAFGITVADANGVSEPATYSCTHNRTGNDLPIGSTTTVSCKAKDARNNEQSAATTFDVFVTLDLSSVSGFLSPLRMAGPFSSHKRGSTVPHKFMAPKYADGSPATDLAGGLTLTGALQSTSTTGEASYEDPATGSTAWRFEDGQYIFNAKSSSAWALGTWKTTVSYAGIVLASTNFVLSK